MASNIRRRVPRHILSADRQTLITLQSLDDYSPSDPACSLAAIQQVEADLAQAEEATIVAQRALEVAREHEAELGVMLHERMLTAKVQVAAQYGPDSPALHAVGRKQRSERRRPTRRARPDE